MAEVNMVSPIAIEDTNLAVANTHPDSTIMVGATFEGHFPKDPRTNNADDASKSCVSLRTISCLWMWRWCVVRIPSALLVLCLIALIRDAW